MSSISVETEEKNNTRVSFKTILIIAGVSIGYLLLSALLIGFKPEQVLLVALYNILYFASGITRKFVTGFSIFVVFWILYDYMKAFPNYWFNEVHIASLYEAEKAVFGITAAGGKITPNEFWLQHHNPVLDVMSGVFYLCWVPVPMAFATYLFFKRRRQFVYFLLTFLLVNLLGFVVYYAYPAAPPWYVQVHGFDFIPLTPGNTAGLARFDAFFGITLFHDMYAKGSNVFAAMPSLHSAYPLVVFYYALKNRLGFMRIVFGIIMVGIWFAAVYTSHHYVLDVLFGIVCAISGITLFNGLMNAKGGVYRAVQKLVTATL